MAHGPVSRAVGSTLRSGACSLLAGCLLSGTAAQAQTPAPAPTPLPPEVLASIRSMGQPPLWKPYAGAFYGLDRSTDRSLDGGAAVFGIYKDLLPSIVAIGASAEGYVGGYDGIGGVDGGVRAVADLRVFFLKAGVDYNVNRKDTSFLLSLNVPIRRGGIFGRGSHLRVDWLPGRGNSWNFGFYFPLEPHMGRTRARKTDVDLPRPAAPPPSRAPFDPAIEHAGRLAREAALWIEQLNVVWWDDVKADRLTSLENTREQIRDFKQRYNQRSATHPEGHNLATEVRILHDQMARAYGLAAGASESEALARGEPIAAQARKAALEEIVYPYNRLLGRFKRHDSLRGLAEHARVRFARWLDANGALDETRRPVVMAVFDGFVGYLEEFRGRFLADVGDARAVWLPFQLVMRPEQHDTQEEIDAIIGRAQGTPFTPGNAVLYTNGQQFQRELNSMIHAAEDYHVLWLHDYDGVDGGGDVDTVGFYQAVDGYLTAMTQRIREYDRTGRFPAYFVLVDVNYYEANRGRLFLDLLEDPLGRDARLPKQDDPQNREMQLKTQAALDGLREAVAQSSRLQELAREHGKDFLRRLIKVHVNVMNLSDPSYRKAGLVPGLRIVPDSAIRDHRKLAFYDLTERDPSRGEAMYGGVGVGEQYATPTWDDRAILVSGPAALTLKDATRRYLRANGFREEQIPMPLRAEPKPADYAAQVEALEAQGADARAVQLHNDRGFAQKDATVTQILLYSLMPPGSLIVVPDSIWTNQMWAAQLVGAALRGCHVYVIAPAFENAPSAGFPQMVRTREIFSRFLEMQKILGPEMEAQGGLLRTGLYARKTPINDVPDRLAEVAAAYERYPFLREEFGLSEEAIAWLAAAPEAIRASGWTPEQLPDDARERGPKLHRKTQFFATREALLAIARSPQGSESFSSQFEYTLQGVTHGPEGLALPNQRRTDQVRPLLEAHRNLPKELRERAVYYLAVGSMNRDARGAILDGEVMFVVSGEWSLWGYFDTIFLFGSTRWVESQEEIDELIPPYKELQRRIARWVRGVV